MSVVIASKYSVGGLSREIDVVSDPENKIIELYITSNKDKRILQGMSTALTQKEAYELAVEIIQATNSFDKDT